MKFVDGKILSFDQQIKQKRGPYYEKFIEKQNQLKIKIALEKAEKKDLNKWSMKDLDQEHLIRFMLSKVTPTHYILKKQLK